MKKYVLVLAIFSHQFASAQQMLGIANSNFAGTTGMNLNPASMLYMPYQWEATILNLNVSFDNNFLSYSAEKNIIKTDGTTPDGHGGLIDDKSTSDKSASLHFLLKAPAFIYRTKGLAFGFYTSLRNESSVRQVPAMLAKYLYEGPDYAPLYGTSINADGMHAGAMTWAELGISAGKVLRKDEDDHLLVAATIKYIIGFQGTYFRVNSGSLNIVNDTLMFPDNFNAEFKNSTPDNPSHLISYPPGRGIGLDVGITYVSKPYEGKATANDANEKKYNYRIGLSFLDLGAVSFTRNASTYNYNLRLSNLVQVRDVDSLIEAGKTGDHFLMGLPSALSLQYDYCVAPRWYLNLTAIQRIPMLMAQVDRPNNLSASLRYETKWFELGVPYSLYEYTKLRVGLAMRYRILFLGTDKLGSFIHIKDDSVSGADVYFGIKLNNFNFRKKPKTRKPCVAFF